MPDGFRRKDEFRTRSDIQAGAGRRGKAEVAKFWNQSPCGSQLASGAAPGTGEFFSRTERQRFTREPFIKRFARFDEWSGRKVLEVGCGTGTDLSMFARHGANAFGLDLTYNGAALALKRVNYVGGIPRIVVGDCEDLPFPDDTFDLVYSWGVIHHSPNTPTAARELLRVARTGGKVLAMIYNRRSLVALQAYLLYGVLRGRPFQPLKEIIASHLESPGTKAYTATETREMFAPLENLSVTPVVTPYDLRIGRNRLMPACVGAFVPRRFGYFMVVEGTKPPHVS